MGRDRGGRERGSVAITVTLAMTVLLGFAALVVDVGLSWAARASAQTAADSAALAGAAELLAGGPAAAVGAVRDYLNDNVNGLADQPTDPNWPFNTNEGDGEIVCWTLPDGPPGPGANCPDGSNALQLITPPIEVNYAFAPVLGASSNSVKAMAAAAAGPAAPNNCVLCLLTDSPNALRVLGVGGVDVSGGGIVVNSDDNGALVLTGTGDVSADQIRVLGGVTDPLGGGQLLPPAELGGPPVPDPLADLPTPDLLPSPPPGGNPAQDITSDTTLSPGVYPSITVSNGAALTLEEGVYVVTETQGFTVTNNATVVDSGDGVTIYLACSGYPAPCSGNGARFRLAGGGQFLADPPTTGEYAGLSIFADRGNTRRMRLLSDADLTLTGALYGASTRLEVTASDLRVDGLLAVGTLLVNLLGSVEVNYDPSVLLPGVGPPVLIR
jgi:Putative Flp pilus-assembly TadE/G-like